MEAIQDRARPLPDAQKFTIPEGFS